MTIKNNQFTSLWRPCYLNYSGNVQAPEAEALHPGMEGETAKDGFCRLDYLDLRHCLPPSRPPMGRQQIRMEQFQSLGLHDRLRSYPHPLYNPPIQARRRVSKNSLHPLPTFFHSYSKE